MSADTSFDVMERHGVEVYDGGLVIPRLDGTVRSPVLPSLHRTKEGKGPGPERSTLISHYDPFPLHPVPSWDHSRCAVLTRRLSPGRQE